MTQSFYNKLYESHQECLQCPSPAAISQFFLDLLETLFPDFSRRRFSSPKELELHLEKLKIELDEMLTRNRVYEGENMADVADVFFERLPAVYERIAGDITAMFEGDPAAKSRSEVIRTYPGFYAIAAYRIAHELHCRKVKIIPRIITEHAHGKTGIDIHPGAQIGENFCIDHGTGVVIGETTQIGRNVKIYQGVTLGALSVDKKDAETKRHPTIEDDVIIYAGATILGGNTVIGKGSVIGGNVWITKSVPEGTKIYYKARMHNSKTDETDVYVYK